MSNQTLVKPERTNTSSTRVKKEPSSSTSKELFPVTVVKDDNDTGQKLYDVTRKIEIKKSKMKKLAKELEEERHSLMFFRSKEKTDLPIYTDPEVSSLEIKLDEMNNKFDTMTHALNEVLNSLFNDVDYLEGNYRNL
ncbi:hypothetical protein C6P40_001630 [Pichia californica]|uniref:Uncharacterized protein n=1 Tax=Pichia californica TaxID=460514 RepID=A0A9P6WQM8_9ASCO|nr:hypothetical protein C6P42_000027 [[Candida] californica]KAG0691346.1 hypothetical protein C6P40_001630 [[Candida] californica]